MFVKIYSNSETSELAINYRNSHIVSEYISNPSLIYDRARATKSSTPKAGIWTDDVVDFAGKYYNVPASKIGPKP